MTVALLGLSPGAQHVSLTFISSQRSQVQHRGEHTTLKLADFGLACSFKKGLHSLHSAVGSHGRMMTTKTMET